MPAMMVDPKDGQIKPLPSVLVLLDGRTAQGDLDQAIGVKAGWLIPPTDPLPNMVRVADHYADAGDGINSVPVPPDMPQADYDAQQAALQADAQARAVQQTTEALAATLPARQAVATLQQAYATMTQQFCSVAGIPVVNVLTADAIQQVIQGLTVGSTAREMAFEIAMDLEVIRTRLIEATGDQHALDAIPVTGAITIPSV